MGVTVTPTYRYFKYLTFLDGFEDTNNGVGCLSEVRDLINVENTDKSQEEKAIYNTDDGYCNADLNANAVDFLTNFDGANDHDSDLNESYEMDFDINGFTGLPPSNANDCDFHVETNVATEPPAETNDYDSDYDFDVQMNAVFQNIQNFDPLNHPASPPVIPNEKIKKKFKQKIVKPKRLNYAVIKEQQSSNTKTWTKEEESEVINFYAAHECLWKCKHPDYYKKNRSSLLDIIYEKLEMKFTGKQLQMKNYKYF